MLDPYNGLTEEGLPCISVTWHNRLLIFAAMIPRKLRSTTCAMVSPSRDGQYITDLLKFFHIKSIRGSSSKKAGAVLGKSLKALNEGYSVSITPDGPRGPIYKLSNGPVILASKTGIPIMPVSVNCSNYWELNTWDKFQIPKPFSKLTLVVGKQIFVPENLSDDELEKWRIKVEDALNDISADDCL